MGIFKTERKNMYTTISNTGEYSKSMTANVVHCKVNTVSSKKFVSDEEIVNKAIFQDANKNMIGRTVTFKNVN